ncbi:MAG: hypothetical protein H0X47_17620 [Nitrospirales bacterium]|nr:hypothetical protein [Nitrospirales bacterium]
MPVFTVRALEFVTEADFEEGSIRPHTHRPDPGAFNLLVFVFLVGWTDLNGLDNMIGLIEFDGLFVENIFIRARRPRNIIGRGFCSMATV